MNNKTAFKYLTLAEQLTNDSSLKAALPETTRQFPSLSIPFLTDLAEQADLTGREHPHFAWAIMAVADAAAQHRPQPLLQAQAAWHLSRAANQWVRPTLVNEALDRAQALFKQLNEPGWLAACQWQRHALPWTSPNFSKAVEELNEALHGLQKAHFDQWVAHCQLSLAYAHILTNNHAQALQLLRESEAAFSNSPFDMACCWLFQASSYRRQNLYQQAIDYLQKAQAAFSQLHTPVHQAMAHYQLALCLWTWGNDSLTAEQQLQAALVIFTKHDLPLWVAMANNALTNIYRNSGRLAEATQVNEKARLIYKTYPIIGLKADNLSDAAILERDKSNYAQALIYLLQAEGLYNQLEAGRGSVAFTFMMQGNIYTLTGRYQQGLHILEKALTYFNELGLADRQAQCQIYLSHVWQQIGRFDLAHIYLNKALAYYQQTNQVTWLMTTLNRQTQILLHENRLKEATAILRQTLELIRQHREEPYRASTLRLLGQLLLADGNPAGAYPYLSEAYQAFIELGMGGEQAICQLVWGQYFYQQHNWPAAQKAWQQAITLNLANLPDIEWQAQAGLAELAEMDSQWDMALSHYYRLSEALEQLRHDFWQANLADQYLSRPGQSLSKAIRLTVAKQFHPDCLHFIEQSKAQIAAHQLVYPELPPSLPLNQQQLTLKAEINWLKEQIRVNLESKPGRIRPNAETQLAQQLKAKVQAYDQLLSQMERDQQPIWGYIPPFHLPRFQRLANTILGNNWIAINYYLLDDTLVYAFLTPAGCLTGQQELPPAISFILHNIIKPGRNISHLTESDRQELGHWLFPSPIRPYLKPDTTLLISPHGQLHKLPWPILLIQGKPLVTISIPVVIPSFHHLELLWQRSPAARHSSETGLLIAISDFQGRHSPLPEASHEAESLLTLLGYCARLRDQQATWSNLQQYSGPAGLSAYHFLHIASHAFHDHITGRISGLALYDQDIWLDELWQIAPLPPLITISACSGSQSLIYAGDEHIGLATSCLAAGAKTVLGCLWPVQDKGLTNLMTTFYKNYLTLGGIAISLAHSQRLAWQQHQPIQNWGGFICIGQP